MVVTAMNTGDSAYYAKKIKNGVHEVKTNDSDIVAAYAYPSKRGVKYKLTYAEFENYCPLCKKHGGLRFNPKRVPEGEWTCKYCGADYCGVTGKDKNWRVRATLKKIGNGTQP